MFVIWFSAKCQIEVHWRSFVCHLYKVVIVLTLFIIMDQTSLRKWCLHFFFSPFKINLAILCSQIIFVVCRNKVCSHGVFNILPLVTNTWCFYQNLVNFLKLWPSIVIKEHLFWKQIHHTHRFILQSAFIILVLIDSLDIKIVFL